MAPAEHLQVKQIAELIALFHDPYFLQALLTAGTPRLDLRLFQDMKTYSGQLPTAAKATQCSIMRQPWHLTGENAVLWLFGEGVSTDENAEVAAALPDSHTARNIGTGKADVVRSR